MAPIVIIGSGLAGYGVAREIRKLDKQQPLLIITADDGRAYSKPMLSNALSRGKQAAELASANADKMAQQLEAEIRTKTWVSAIDSQQQTIRIGSELIPYAKLVLALGADPFRPPIEGDSDAVLSINDLGDYERFRNAIDGKRNVAILGGGLIGCEFANDLAASGYHVDLIDRNPLPLGKLLPAPAGEQLLAALQGLGVQWHANTTASQLFQTATGFELTLADGHAIESEVVLSAIGLRARTQLAETAGLKINRAIVTDAYLKSSVANIYALGDCAEVAGHHLPFVLPLTRANKALAQTLTGTPTAVSYPAMPVILKTPACPIAVMPPPPGQAGEWQIKMEDDTMRALFMDGQQLHGFVLSNKAVMEANKLAQQIPVLF